MNGRVYDYNLGRFMSVDPFIQSPTSTQSVNPYSYIMNNPLAGTDPTGYVGCAASRIESTCDSTLSRYGGNGKADASSFGGNKSGGSRSNGSSAAGSKPTQTAQNINSVGSLQQNAGKQNQSYGNDANFAKDDGTNVSGGIKQAAGDLLTDAGNITGELAADAWEGLSFGFNAVKDGVASDFEDGMWEGIVRFTGGRNGDDALAEMRQNFLSTSIVAGSLKDLDKKAVSAMFAGELTKRNGGMTFGQWLKTGFKTAPHLQTRAATAGFVACDKCRRNYDSLRRG